MNTWIQTYSGGKFDFSNPQPKDVRLADIAHSLSMQCRFNGHTRKFYSVAEHCTWVGYLLRELARTARWEGKRALLLELYGYLHDAHEAYIGDVVSPMKNAFKGKDFDDLDVFSWMAVAEAFGLEGDEEIARLVHRADLHMLAVEARQVFVGGPVGWLPDYQEGFPGVPTIEYLVPFEGETRYAALVMGVLNRLGIVPP